MSRKFICGDTSANHINTIEMKLGDKLFQKNRALWTKPLIAYDETKMNALFSEIAEAEGVQSHEVHTTNRPYDISLETELYLILNS